jgi:hypothetical protein
MLFLSLESGAMLADDGFGLDDEEELRSNGTSNGWGNPKGLVQPVQLWPSTLAFEYGDLLPLGQDLKSDITLRGFG